MSTLPFQSLVAALTGWVNRGHPTVIEYLQEENRVQRLKYRLRAGEISIRPDRHITRCTSTMGWHCPRVALVSGRIVGAVLGWRLESIHPGRRKGFVNRVERGATIAGPPVQVGRLVKRSPEVCPRGFSLFCQ
jgi:hypothetical protein